MLLFYIFSYSKLTKKEKLHQPRFKKSSWLVTIKIGNPYETLNNLFWHQFLVNYFIN